MPAEPADAQPVVQGPIFRASTDPDVSDNWMPAAAMALDGSFAVVWEASGVGDSRGTLARHYGSDGSPSGDPFFVHRVQARSRANDVGMNGRGSFAVSWENWDAVYVRRFASNGEPLDASEIHVTDGSRHSSVGIADDDSVAVVYSTGPLGMVVQFFDSGGSRGDEVTIPGAIYGLGEHFTPFAVGPDGYFVIAYMKDWHQRVVYARYWRSSTRTLSEEITIASHGTPVEAAMAADGSFTVVYFGGTSSGVDFKVARYDGVGNEVYNKTVYTAADQYRLHNPWGNIGASVARDGSFLIVWCTYKYQPPFEAHTYAMAFDSDGTPRTPELLVSDPQTAEASKYYPAVGTNGKKVVAIWEQMFPRKGDQILGRLVTLGPTSPRDLIEIVQEMLDDELISNAGIANAKISSLENAQAMLDAGNVGAAVNKLHSLKRQIAAQAGKKIDLGAAATLIEHLGSLLDQLEEQSPAGGTP